MFYKAIIDGKTYNTETATRICSVPCRAQSRTDFGWHDTNLYRTKRGAFFVAGRGNAASMWAQSVGMNGSTGGSGIRTVSAQEARDWMEAAGCDEEAFAAVGLPVEEA